MIVLYRHAVYTQIITLYTHNDKNYVHYIIQNIHTGYNVNDQ